MDNEPKNHRCFIAIPVPLAIKLSLFESSARLCTEREELRQVPMDNYHITLCFLGNIGMDSIRQLIIKLGGMSQSGFSCCLSKIAPFPPKKPQLLAAYVDKNDALLHFFLELKKVCTSLGLGMQEHGFLPHITLARARHRIDSETQGIDKRFSIERWGLYESISSQSGVTYHPIAEFPFLEAK